MQEIGRITTRIKLGGGLNLLCLAGAGYVVVKTLTKMAEFNNTVKQGEMLEALHENCRDLSDLIKQRKSDEDAEAKEEVAE